MNVTEKRQIIQKALQQPEACHLLLKCYVYLCADAEPITLGNLI
jgi:hypothetical protein